MSHAHAARGARQTAVLAAIVGLHFAVFLIIAMGLQPPPVVQTEPKPITVLPMPEKPKPEEAVPPAGPIDDFYPDAYPPPDFPLPDFKREEPTAVLDRDGAAGEAVTINPLVDIVPPSLRTRPASVAAAINSCYPAASRRMNEEGTVVALVTIGAAGSAVNWSVAQSSGFARLDAAIACVLKKLDFVAGRQDGQAVAAEARLPIVFRLD